MACIVVLYIPIRLYIRYKEKKLDFSIHYGKIKIRIPLGSNKKAKSKTGEKKEKKEKEDDFGNFRKFIALIQAFYDTSPKIRKTIIVERLKADSVYGTTDAAFTGMAVGFAYAEIYKLIGFISTIFTVKQPEITIKPVFGEESVFEIEGEGIIKTKAAHIISTAIKFYFNYKKALR